MKKHPFKKIKGSFNASGKTFGIIVSQFNEYLTTKLLDGAVDTLTRHGAKASSIHVFYVPGAFEMPLTLKKILKQKRFDAVIALAVVIKGATKHFDQVVTQSAKGIREVSLAFETPVILGIIPASTIGQALLRVGIKQANKGREWALSAIEMASLMEKLKVRSKR